MTKKQKKVKAEISYSRKGTLEEKTPLQKPITEEHAKDTRAEEEPKISYFALFKFATSLDKALLVFGSLCAVAVGIAMPIMLLWLGLITGHIIDFVVGMNHTSTNEEVKILKDDLFGHLHDYVIKVCSTGAVAILLAYISGVLFTYTSTKQVTKIRQMLLSQMLNADIGWHDSNKTTDFTTTFTENLSIIGDSLGTKTSWFLNNGGSVVTCFILSLYHGWQLSLVCFSLLPVTTIIVGFITWLSAKMSSQELQSHSSAGSLAEEVLSAIRTVVAFDGQKKEVEIYEKFLVEGKKSNIRKALFNGLSMGVSQSIMYITCGIAYWYGAQLVTQNLMEPLDVRVYTPATVNIIYMTSFTVHFKIQQMLPLIDVFGSAKGAAVKVFAILNMKPVINASKVGGKTFPSINGHINFRNVFFNYPSRQDVKILRGVDLEIKSGQTVALVGHSGCGKSTIVQLVQRFYDPQEGSVLLDGTDLKELNLVWLRKQIGVVSQEPVLFDTSILENIRYGNPLATDADIENAAKKANAHGFISHLPQGYHTHIGEGGAQLSGGQKQRVAIARALVKRPRILLLDEATSALDTTSEAEVQAALDKIEHECTTIIVAHRLSTVRNADKIVVMSDGEIKEQGTHTKLMELRGAYYKLVESQEMNVEEMGIEQTLTTKTSRQVSKASSKDDLHEEEKEDTQQQNKEEPSSIFEVLKYNKSQLHLILLGCIMAIIGGCTKPIQSILFGDMVGMYSNEDGNLVRAIALRLCLSYVILAFVAGGAYVIQHFVFAVSGERLTLKLRKQMFEVIINKEIGWHDRKENGVGSLCAKLSSEPQSVQMASGPSFGIVLNCITTLVAVLGVALYFNWKLALVQLCFAPLIIVSAIMEKRVTSNDAELKQQALEKSVKIAVEGISNIRTVASIGCENIFYNSYAHELEKFRKLITKRMHLTCFTIATSVNLMFFASAVGFGYAIKLIIEEGAFYGDAFKVIEVINSGSWICGHFFAYSPDFNSGLIAAKQIFKLIRSDSKSTYAVKTSSYPEGDITYDNVYFSYPTRPSTSVLNGFNLKVLNGKTIALVGSSGGGKSTVIQLLLRYYEPMSGRIAIGDEDINSIDPSVFRQRLGVVSQEPNLFDRTISENIAYGANDREVSLAEITDAAKAANIHNFVCSLPLGYETRLGLKGTQLSGGQKQRIAIARALIRKPQILLLDEATSALDNESEKVVQEALDKAREGRTCLTIAHRLTTIKDADLICVIKDGRVVEIGTHEELLDKKAAYYEYYKLQAGHR